MVSKHKHKATPPRLVIRGFAGLRKDQRKAARKATR